MDDVALKAAEEKLAGISQQIAEHRNLINDAMSRLSTLQHEAAELDNWIRMWHRFAGTAHSPTAAKQSEISLPVVAKPKVTRPKNPDREMVAEKALALIEERGVPMSRRELFDALAARGIIIRGKDPEMVLSTMLWRSKDRIVRLPNHGYWPAHLSFLPAIYDPDIEDLLGSAANEPEDGMEVEEDGDDEIEIGA